jgi:hypothetical protein
MNLDEKIALIAIAVGFLQFLALVITIGVQKAGSKRQLRAYVYPDNAGLVDGTMLTPPQENRRNEPGITMLLKNSGQTPAYEVRSWANINIIEPINESRLEIPKLSSALSNNNVGSNGMISKAVWFGRALTSGEIEDIEKGVKAIYLFGRIEYRDVFKKDRFTNFRLFYSGKFPVKEGMNFYYCQKGNESD